MGCQGMPAEPAPTPAIPTLPPTPAATALVSEPSPTATAAAAPLPTGVPVSPTTPTPPPQATLPPPTDAPPLEALRLEPVWTEREFREPTNLIQMQDGRMLVAEQDGRVWAFDPAGSSVPAATEFLDITDRVSSRRSEEGLLGLALDPTDEQRLYVYYSAADPRRSVVSRFTLAADGSRADPASELVILEVGQPFANHNGGQIAFGPDGYLYIGLGDGGSAGDPLGSGQDTSTLLGSILRIDVSQSGPERLYAIPPDNPFASGGGRAEIWAYGLRNPWRFSFDRDTGELWTGDVGQNRWEEIDLIARGGNYGWNRLEGSHCFSARDCDPHGHGSAGVGILAGRPTLLGDRRLRVSRLRDPVAAGRLRVRRLLLGRGVRAEVCGWAGGGARAAGRHRAAHHVVRRGQRRRAVPAVAEIRRVSIVGVSDVDVLKITPSFLRKQEPKKAIATGTLAFCVLSGFRLSPE